MEIIGNLTVRIFRGIATRFAYAILFLLLSFDARAQAEIKPKIIDDLKTTVQKIVRRYPSSQYYYVGIGGSPTLIIALMQEAGLDAANLPVSRNGALLPSVRLDPSYRSRLLRHIKSFLPKPNELGQRSILVMDYSWSGGGLMDFKECLDYYVGQGEIQASAKYLALVGRDSSLEYLDGQVDQIKVPVNLDADLSTNRGFKSIYREYPSWSASVPEEVRPNARPEYMELREQLRHAVNKDVGFVNRIKAVQSLNWFRKTCSRAYSAFSLERSK